MSVKVSIYLDRIKRGDIEQVSGSGGARIAVITDGVASMWIGYQALVGDKGSGLFGKNMAGCTE